MLNKMWLLTSENFLVADNDLKDVAFPDYFHLSPTMLGALLQVSKN